MFLDSGFRSLLGSGCDYATEWGEQIFENLFKGFEYLRIYLQQSLKLHYMPGCKKSILSILGGIFQKETKMLQEMLNTFLNFNEVLYVLNFATS